MPIIATIAILAVAIAGCGGSSGSEATAKGTYSVDGQTYTVQASTTMTTATPPLSKAQFVTRAGKFCREAWVTILDNFTKFRSWQNQKWSPQKLFAYSVHLSLLAGIDFHIFDNFYQLGAPRGDKEELEEMIGAMQLAVERGARQHFSSVADVIAQFEDYNRLARSYGGLDDCLVDEAHLHTLEA